MNIHGLPRDIPESVKRAVRQRCGFGCVICGSAVVQYHHFAPEYAQATEHHSEGITLLCGRCHDKARHTSTDEISRHDRSPFCKRQGFVHDFLFASREKISFQIGSAIFKRHAILVYDEESIISFAPPEEPGAPLRLFARLQDDDEKDMLEIADNEWRAGTDFFDLDTSGNTFLIRRKLKDITLKMILRPTGDITIERLKLGYKGFKVLAEKGKFLVRIPNGGQFALACPNIYSTLTLSSDGGVRL
jgi:hypothetical protein